VLTDCYSLQYCFSIAITTIYTVYIQIDPQSIYDPSIALPLPLFGRVLRLTKAEVHAVGISLLVSIVGPYGGFIASAIKRAFDLKDFGNT
jgi:CDP-diglyceride synthetase